MDQVSGRISSSAASLSLGCGFTVRRAFLRLLDHRSVVPKESLVPLVIADPDDANLGAQGRAACDGVQGSPTLRQLEAEEVW